MPAGDLPGSWGPGKRGALDGDPISICLLLFMLFVLFNWMTQPGGPLVGCAACQTNVAKFWSPGNPSTTWMIYLVVPLAFLMFATYLADQVTETDEGKAGDILRQLRPVLQQTDIGAAKGLGAIAKELRAGVSGGARTVASKRARAIEARNARLEAQLAAERPKLLEKVSGPSTKKAISPQDKAERMLERRLQRRVMKDIKRKMIEDLEAAGA